MTTIPADAAPCVTRDGWCETHNCPSNLVTDHAWVGIAGHPDDPECPGSGGGWEDDGAMDRTPTTYFYACELCDHHHEDRRPKPPFWHRVREAILHPFLTSGI